MLRPIALPRIAQSPLFSAADAASLRLKAEDLPNASFTGNAAGRDWFTMATSQTGSREMFKEPEASRSGVGPYCSPPCSPGARSDFTIWLNTNSER
jgi:hypothetical protein